MAQRRILLKFGWLPLRYGWLAAALAIAAPAPAANGTRIVFAGGHWAAIDFESRCEARSRPLWFRPGTKPFAGFAFDPSGRLHGQFYVHLGSVPRAGSSVVVTIGDQPFLLVGKGEWAWSGSTGQQRAILKAARFGQAMRIDSHDSSGRRIVERYDLSGAPTAIDSAAAACAGKSGRA